MKFTEFTDKGGRVSNDDYISNSNAGGIHLFAVADGMGENGRLASELAVKTVTEEFEKEPKLDPSALRAYIEKAQQALLEKKSENQEYDTADTTLAVLLTNGTEALYAHCGDTRIYILQRKHISEISDDHSAAFEGFKAGEIDYADIRKSPVKHHLRRAIGDRISWEPEVSDLKKIDSSYSFLICTDGFWNLIYENEIEKAIGFSSSSGWLQKMLKIISRRLTPKSDNLTAVTIQIQKTDLL